MSVFISRKQSLLILAAAFALASGTAVLLNYLLAGPRLGPVYDFLRARRPAPPVSREITIIDTGEIVESGDVFTVLMTLSEMEAAALVIDVPVLGSFSGRIESDEEIQRRLNDEYALLGRNIRNLFEAIRVGSVPPSESSGYVESLVELAERGKDRLTAALIRQDEAGALRLAQASAVFGAALAATDLRSRPAEDSRWYARPRPDRDGRLRRIAPLLGVKAQVQDEPPVEAAAADAPDEPSAETAAADTPDEPLSQDQLPAQNEPPALPPVVPAAVEHIVYRSLKPRWEHSEIEYAEQGPVLTLRRGGQETRIPLDRHGNILIEKTDAGEGFRRLALSRFREYEEADRVMGRLLKEAEAQGVYSATSPEQIPLIRWEYAAGLREELLEVSLPPGAALPEERGPLNERRSAWIAARAAYFSSLEELLYGPAEMTLVSGYEEIIATEQLKDESLVKLQMLRDELIRAFVALREQHRRLTALRSDLAETLAAAVCVMGPASPGEAGPVEASVLLANALLSGSHIIPAQTRYVIFWSLGAVLLVLAAIRSLRPAMALLAGCAAALICAGIFGWSFVISGWWIDPFIPAIAGAAGTVVIFNLRLALVRRGARRFRYAYGPAVSKPCLKELVRAGRPLLSEINVVPAAVIAVKDPALYGQEGRETPDQAARAAAEFHGAVTPLFKQAGAVIVACGGNIVLACFGSPPELLFQERVNAEKGEAVRRNNPAARAGDFIAELLRQSRRPWFFGIDWGECAFSWSAETGYTANGRPLVRARVLASLGSRCRAQVIITSAVREQIAQPTKKISIPGPGGPDRDSFPAGVELYELLVENSSEKARS
jgi:CHASE2 domain-containing sensor protein